MDDEDDSILSGRFPVRDPEHYPWHLPVWRRLTHDISRLPHAILFCGPPGLAKTAFALRLARALACLNPDENRDGCGRCNGCLLVAAGTHPDIHYVFVEEDRTQISIDQIRSVIEFLTLKPHAATRRVVVLSPAEAMNTHAANALLKVLEESPDGLLLLVSSQPARLPATVRSRCARIAFDTPETSATLDWLSSPPRNVKEASALLRVAAGSPQRALEYAKSGFDRARKELTGDLTGLLDGRADPLACARRWRTIGAVIVLDWFYGAVADLVRLFMIRDSSPVLNNEELLEAMKNRIYSLNIKDLYIILQSISDARNLLQTSIDEQLILEEFSIRITRLAKRSSTISSQQL